MSKGHGRLERRELRVSADLADYNTFPDVEQVAEVRTQGLRLATGELSARVRYLVTSLPPDQASPRQMLELSRGHGASKTGSSMSKTTVLARTARCCRRTRRAPR